MILELLYMTIGFILVISVLYYLYYLMYSKTQQQQTGGSQQPSYPPNVYMREVGLMCPDYWSYQGTKDNKVMCRNTFNLPTNNPEYCMDDGNVKSFSQINRWPVDSNELPGVLQDRCEWVRQCGQKKGQAGSWLGVAENC